jgi:hypothetical protein
MTVWDEGQPIPGTAITLVPPPPSIYSCRVGLWRLAIWVLPCPLSLLMHWRRWGTWDSPCR